MKNKKLLQFFIYGLLSVLTIYGQEQNASFADGVTVMFENKVGSESSKSINQKVKVINVLSSRGGVNTVHRVFINRENKDHFGYDLEVKKEAEKGKFTVTFKPLTVRLFVADSEALVLPKYPAPLQINEGDAISVDLLENSKTKEKIADFIKIVQGEANPQKNNLNQAIISEGIVGRTITRISNSENSLPKDLNPDEIRMQLVNLTLSQNGKTILERKTIVGANVFFYLKGKGRFILSPFPRAGFNFQKIGVIDGNKISFALNGDSYEITALIPIICFGGKWNLWVLHEPDYRPASDNSAEQLGGGSIDSLIKKP